MGEATPPAPQSNQNAGAGEKPCPWCVLWNAAFAASRLPLDCGQTPYNGNGHIAAVRLQAIGVETLTAIVSRDTDCPGCQRSAEIYLGDVLGPDRRAWRAEMWEINPSMRFMMRQGVHDAEFSR